MDNRETRVIEYFNSLDWGNMTAGEDLIRNMERLVATTGDRDRTLQLFRFLKMQLEGTQKIAIGEVKEEDIRTLEEIMGDVLRYHNRNVPTPYTVSPEDVQGGVVRQELQEEPTIGTNPVNANSGLQVPVPRDGLEGFDLTFDEDNEVDDSVTSSHVVINRRGSGEPVVGDTHSDEPNTDQAEQQNNTGDEGVQVPQGVNSLDTSDFMEELLEGFVGQTGDIILGKDVDDEDKEHVHTNAMMMSYFSLQPANAGLPTRIDSNGQIPMDYAVSVLVTHEVRDGETEGLSDEVLIAGTVEQAIDLMDEQGFIYNKNKNIFSKENEYGLRSYARITFDVDLRAVLGQR